MAPKLGSRSVDKGSGPNTTSPSSLLSPNEKWIPVTWMPCANLSQTSHVSLKVRSAQVTREPKFGGISCGDPDYSEAETEFYEEDDEWRVNATLLAGGGELLRDVGYTLSLSSQTPAATVESRSYQSATNLESVFHSIPRVSGSTHECHWEAVVQIALRWRDLPRDSYILFEVLDWDDSVVSFLLGCEVILRESAFLMCVEVVRFIEPRFHSFLGTDGLGLVCTVWNSQLSH